jgi:hypothetical protein
VLAVSPCESLAVTVIVCEPASSTVGVQEK